MADPAVYEHLDILFPGFDFRRIQQGSDRDHWASRYKMDLTLPRTRNAEKTVVYRSEMKFREQGDWQSGIGIMDKITNDNGFHSIYEAYRHVASRLSLDMPQPDTGEVSEAVSREQRRTSLLETLVDYFGWNLMRNSSNKAESLRRYLKERRGFTTEQVSMLRLGFVPEWSKVIRHVTIGKGFRIEELDDVCGVRNADGYTSVGRSHILSIPYECGGVVKGFIFRRIDDSRDGPKYIATADLDRKSAFFNIPADVNSKGIIVVEGEIDSLKATSEGIRDVVAIGGSEISGERRRQVEDAFRRGVDRITLCLDLDPVKEEPDRGNIRTRHAHLMRSIHTIKDVAPSFEGIFVALFNEPSDPDEFIRARGADAFRTLLARAVPYWQYAYDYYSSQVM